MYKLPKLRCMYNQAKNTNRSLHTCWRRAEHSTHTRCPHHTRTSKTRHTRTHQKQHMACPLPLAAGSRVPSITNLHAPPTTGLWYTPSSRPNCRAHHLQRLAAARGLRCPASASCAHRRAPATPLASAKTRRHTCLLGEEGSDQQRPIKGILT